RDRTSRRRLARHRDARSGWDRGAGADQGDRQAPSHPVDHDLWRRRYGEHRALPRGRGRGLPAETVRPGDPQSADRRRAQPEAPERPGAGPCAHRVHTVPARADRGGDACAERGPPVDPARAPVGDRDVRRSARLHDLLRVLACGAGRHRPEPVPRDDGGRRARPRRNPRRLPRGRPLCGLRRSDRKRRPRGSRGRRCAGHGGRPVIGLQRLAARRGGPRWLRDGDRAQLRPRDVGDLGFGAPHRLRGDRRHGQHRRADRAAHEEDGACHPRRRPDADEHDGPIRRPDVRRRVRDSWQAVEDRAVDRRRVEGSVAMTDVEPTVDVGALRDRVDELEALESEHRRSEHVQAALYRIAETAGAAHDMQEFYAAIHGIVGELMYAKNFYVVLYDEERRMMNWPFFVDEVDTDWPDPNVWEPMGTGQSRGITSYLLRKGTPMLLPQAEADVLLEQGEFDQVGARGVDWLGVPLRSEGRIVGAMVVQSYEGDPPHSQQDKDLLSFVASHVGSALSRARAIEETRQRNAELALINDV